MQPRLWSRHMTFQEWRLQHRHLNDREALQLYMAEQRLFENYERDLINQQLLIQNNIIAENIYNLADNISNIFNVSLHSAQGIGDFSHSLPGDQSLTSDLELITDEGDLLITDEGEFLIT
jgi:hypothetical protein